MTLSIATNAVPGEVTAKFKAIADAGFSRLDLSEHDFTGFDGSAADFAALVHDHGLAIELMYPFRNFEGLTGDQRPAALDRLNRKLDLVSELGCSKLLVQSTRHPDAVGDFDHLARDLSDMADRAAERNVSIAYLALPWARFTTCELAALELIDAVDKPNFGLCLNSFFSLADGSKPARINQIPGSRISHVQLSDAPLVDMDLRHLANHFRLLPGQGHLNLAGFLRVVAKSGYNGTISLDGTNDIRPLSGPDTVARDSYRALLNVLDKVAKQIPEASFDIPDLPDRVAATGFEFVEFAVSPQDAEILTSLLETLGFRMERRHISKNVELWRQGAVNLVINTENEGFAHAARVAHGPTVCDMGLRVGDASQTARRAELLGVPQFSQPVGAGELEIPAIRGVGGNVVHFIDERSDLHRVWDIEFDTTPSARATQPSGLRRIDHVAQTMKQAEMQSWLLYYISTFDMEKSPVVDVTDPSGHVYSQAIQSPEGEVRLNLNGVDTGRTFAGAFLADRVGAGVQHMAFATDDIFETSELLDTAGFPRLAISSNYYDDLQAEFHLDDALTNRLRESSILYDRNGSSEYFQIYSQPIFDGFFFEVIERRGGYQGYGARNAPFRLAAQSRHKRPEGLPRS